jgi:hypothetical protein
LKYTVGIALLVVILVASLHTRLPNSFIFMLAKWVSVCLLLLSEFIDTNAHYIQQYDPLSVSSFGDLIWPQTPQWMSWGVCRQPLSSAVSGYTIVMIHAMIESYFCVI